MTISCINAVNNYSITASTTFTTSLNTNFSVGDMLVVFVGADNAGASGVVGNIVSMTGTGFDTFIRRRNDVYDPGSASTGVEIAIFTATCITDRLSTDTVTINFTNSTGSKVALGYKVSSSNQGILNFSTSGANVGSATATPTVTTSIIATNNLVIAGLAAETNANLTAGDTDTINGTWSSVTNGTANTGTLLTSIRMSTQYKIQTTAFSTQTFNPTQPASDCIAAWMSISETFAPDAPTNVIGTPDTNTVNLSWTAPVNDNGAAIIDYTVEKAVSPYTVWSTTSGGSVSTAVSQTVSLLTSGVSYKFRVAAINSIGTGPWSTVSGVITTKAPPTVILNTADGFNFGTDTTPTLEFTGTDVNNDNITYRVDIFTNASGLISSYISSNAVISEFGQLGGNIGIGESIIGYDKVISSVSFVLTKNWAVTGNVVAKIYAATGVHGTNAIPNGTALAISDTVDVTTIPTSPTTSDFIFTFSGVNQIQLALGTTYIITMEYASGISGHGIRTYVETTSPTYPGNRTVLIGTTWSAYTTSDLVFNLTPSDGLIKVSDIDAGFLNTVNSGNTNPFTSGEKVSFTLQSSDALASNTYYWKVYGIDKLGSNIYGPGSETRSFIVESNVVNLINQYWGVKV